jgi:hypothetical protein
MIGTDMNAPRRRGRPPVTEQSAIAGNTSGEVAEAPAKRRRRAAVTGLNLKLAAPERAGMQRRWFNDVPGRLAEANELAYGHVKDASIKSDGTDSRVRRLVGTQANGQPLYAYLMETPVEEYQAGIQEREEIHAAVDTAINEGRDATGRITNGYGEGSIKAG